MLEDKCRGEQMSAGQDGQDEIAERKRRGEEIMGQLTGSTEATTALLTNLAPQYAEWVTEFALGQVWARPGLDLKTRSLCTVAALTVQGRIGSLKTHIRGALGNGATRDEIIEVILHMTVYGGFPDAWDGLAAAREVFAALDKSHAQPEAEIAGPP